MGISKKQWVIITSSHNVGNYKQDWQISLWTRSLFKNKQGHFYKTTLFKNSFYCLVQQGVKTAHPPRRKKALKLSDNRKFAKLSFWATRTWHALWSWMSALTLPNLLVIYSQEPFTYYSFKKCFFLKYVFFFQADYTLSTMRMEIRKVGFNPLVPPETPPKTSNGTTK